jgi:hypothetical protein
VVLAHQPTSLPALLWNQLQVQTLYVQKSKKAPLGRLSTLVGCAGYASAHRAPRPAGDADASANMAPGHVVEPAAGSNPARAEKQKGAFRAPFYIGGSCRIRTCDQLIKSQLLYQLS